MPVDIGHNVYVPRRARTATADLGDLLIDAASELLEAEGPEALSVRRIAAHAGVAPMSVYNRFGAKEGLVDEVFSRHALRLAHICDGIDRDRDVIEQLQGASLIYRRFALDRPHSYALMFMKSIPDFVPSEESVRLCIAGFEQLVEAVRVAQASGRIVRGDVSDLAERIWATEHGLVTLELVGIGFAADRLGHYCDTIDTVLRGMMTDPSTLRSSRAFAKAK
jgi:AcrR family transcriptional regulator